MPSTPPQVDHLLSRVPSDPVPDRRREERHRFEFPVQVHGPNATQSGMSTDLSARGIGTILPQPYPTGTVARLVITCGGNPISVRARLVWTLDSAEGEVRCGWQFLDADELQEAPGSSQESELRLC